MVCRHRRETTKPCRPYLWTEVLVDTAKIFGFLQQLAHRLFALQEKKMKCIKKKISKRNINECEKKTHPSDWSNINIINY